MSMIANFLKITPSQLQAVRDDPERAAALVFRDDGSQPEPPAALDLDKAWHLIHFLLVGEAWGGEGTLASAILGGEVLDGTDTGYGPFRYLGPGQVRAVADALQEVPGDALWQRFDPENVASAGIYPSAWEGGGDDERYVREHFENLKRFYAEAADADSALLLYVA